MTLLLLQELICIYELFSIELNVILLNHTVVGKMYYITYLDASLTFGVIVCCQPEESRSSDQGE